MGGDGIASISYDVQRLNRELLCAICRVSDDGEGRGQEEFDR